MAAVHNNSNIKVSLLRVKIFKVTLSHFCNVNSDLQNRIKNCW